MTHYGDAAIEYAIEKTQSNLHGLNFKDGSPYFSLHQRGPNALKVYLTRSLEDDFEVGRHCNQSTPNDAHTLSIL